MKTNRVATGVAGQNPVQEYPDRMGVLEVDAVSEQC